MGKKERGDGEKGKEGKRKGSKGNGEDATKAEEPESWDAVADEELFVIDKNPAEASEGGEGGGEEKKKKKKKKSKGGEEGQQGRRDGDGDEGEGGEEEKPEDKSRGSKRGSEAGRLDDSILPYVKQVATLAKANDFEADEDRKIFVDNVWRELKMSKSEQLVRLITHKDGSTAVQSLLPLSSPKQLYRLCKGLQGAMPRVIFNPYGSHVIEAIFGFVPRLVNASMEELQGKDSDDEEEEENEEGASGELESLEKMFAATCDELAGGWMEIMMDARGSHVLRAIIRALAGLEQREKEGGNKAGPKQTHGHFRQDEWTRHPVPKSFTTRLRSIGEELAAPESTAELSDMALNSASAPVLQLLLLAAKANKKLSLAVSRALLRWGEGEKAPDKAWVLKLAADESGSHMLEAVLEALPPADLQPVLECFRGSLLQMSRQKTANHVVQRLMDKAVEAPHVKLLLQELGGDHLAELLQWNRAGVIKSLADACARAEVGQGELVRGLAGAMGLSAPAAHPRLIPSLLLLRTLPEGFADTGAPKPISPFAAAPAGAGARPGFGPPVAGVLGSLLVQAIMKFKEADMGPILTSLGTMPVEYLSRIACDPAGSRALEAALSSTTVPLKVKHKLAERLTPFVVMLAAHRIGSHVVEGLHKACAIDEKRELVRALAVSVKTLLQSPYGNLVCKRCRVQQFVDAEGTWELAEVSNVKKRSMFADILGDEVEDKGAKKKKKKEEGAEEGEGKSSKSSKGGEKKDKKGKRRRDEDEDEEEDEGAAVRKAKDLVGGKLDKNLKALGVGGDEEEDEEDDDDKPKKKSSKKDADLEDLFSASTKADKPKGKNKGKDGKKKRRDD